MKRWGIVALGVVLFATVAVLGWRVLDMSDDLDAARRDVQRLGNQARSLSNGLDRARDELAAARREAGVTANALREARRELRHRQPCGEGGGPHLWLFPDSGPVGTRVDFVGDCFVRSFEDTAEEIERSPYGLFLHRVLSDCELLVFTDDLDVQVTKGRAEGSFTVGDGGGCFQTDRSMTPPPGSYGVSLRCHACSTGATFRITP